MNNLEIEQNAIFIHNNNYDPLKIPPNIDIIDKHIKGN